MIEQHQRSATSLRFTGKRNQLLRVCVRLYNVYFSVLNMLMQNNRIQRDCVNRTKACLSQRGEKKRVALWDFFFFMHIHRAVGGSPSGKTPEYFVWC